MNLGGFVQKYDPLGAKLQSYDPVASAVLRGGRHGPQPNVAAPKWHEVSPGRWEMEGGQQPPMATGGLRGLGASLFPPSQPGMGTGGPGQVSPMGNFARFTGGGGQIGQMPQLQTGGGLTPMQAPAWMTGGGMQQMGGGAGQSSYFQADPYDGGFAGNFGMAAFR